MKPSWLIFTGYIMGVSAGFLIQHADGWPVPVLAGIILGLVGMIADIKAKGGAA